MRKELTKFLGFERVGGNRVVARFQHADGDTFVLDHHNTQVRAENLRRDGSPCDETERALAAWPQQEEG